jgi:hypothetical protein
LVEQRTENPRVGGSIPPLGTISFSIAQTPVLAKARSQKAVLSRLCNRLNPCLTAARMRVAFPQRQVAAWMGWKRILTKWLLE